jgi:hypothetical protein
MLIFIRSLNRNTFSKPDSMAARAHLPASDGHPTVFDRFGPCNRSNIGLGFHPCRSGGGCQADNRGETGVQQGQERCGIDAGLMN